MLLKGSTSYEDSRRIVAKALTEVWRTCNNNRTLTLVDFMKDAVVYTKPFDWGNSDYYTISVPEMRLMPKVFLWHQYKVFVDSWPEKFSEAPDVNTYDDFYYAIESYNRIEHITRKDRYVSENDLTPMRYNTHVEFILEELKLASDTYCSVKCVNDEFHLAEPVPPAPTGQAAKDESASGETVSVVKKGNGRPSDSDLQEIQAEIYGQWKKYCNSRPGKKSTYQGFIENEKSANPEFSYDNVFVKTAVNSHEHRKKKSKSALKSPKSRGIKSS